MAFVPLDPGNPVDLVPGGGALVVLFVVLFIAAIGFGIWRMTLVNSAAKSMGLSDEQRLLAVTDEHGGTAVVAGAVMGEALAARADESAAGGDLATRLAALQEALDQRLITADEFAVARQRILDGA